MFDGLWADAAQPLLLTIFCVGMLLHRFYFKKQPNALVDGIVPSRESRKLKKQTEE
jgi:hypothetical protein